MPDLRLKRYEKEYTVVECLECGHRYLNPCPTPESIPLLYDPAYYQGRRLDDTRQLDRWEKMVRLLPSVHQGRILDVGCAGGAWLKVVRERAWECYGTDMHQSPYLESGIKYQWGCLPELEYVDSYFDVITAWGVMEHIYKPSVYFNTIRRLLKKGGLFIFLVPNADSIWSRWAYKEDIPRHLHFFRKKTLCRYAVQNDMKIKDILFTNTFSPQPATGRTVFKRRFMRLCGASWREMNEGTQRTWLSLAGKFGTLCDYLWIHPWIEERLRVCGNMVVVLAKK